MLYANVPLNGADKSLNGCLNCLSAEKGRGWSELQVSASVKNIPEALSIYMNQLVYTMRRNGTAVQTLSLGEAYFDIPLLDFSALDVEKGCHYSDSRGLPELLEKIGGHYARRYGAAVDWKSEIMITAGSKAAIFMALKSVLNPGDEVLMPEPAWLSYPEQVKLAGGTPRFIPHSTSVQDYGTYITETTKVLILNNPNNPAGKNYSYEELLFLYKLCRPRGIYILADEAYSDFVSETPFTSLASVVPDKDGVIVVNSLSKNLGISGWRIGYVISSAQMIQNILKLNQHLITCAPTILQMYLAKYFDELIKITAPQVEDVVRKRGIIRAYLKEIGLPCLDGDATFYLFLDISRYGRSTLEFAYYLLFKYHIAVVPGGAYGESTSGFIRIGVGVEPVDRLKEAIDVIHRVAAEKEYDQELVDRELKALGAQWFCE